MTEPHDAEQPVLDQLAADFLRALSLKDRGEIDDAESTLRDILRTEPRLAEPHMELARLLLDTDRVKEAEPHAREALSHLEAGGQWTDDLPENVIQGLAHGLLAEILRRRAEDDEVLFGDPAVFKEMLAESRTHFERASELDPSDEYASYHAFFLGVGKTKELPGDWKGEPGEA
jgi:tetratricopeptide (TPR) repeat protein